MNWTNKVFKFKRLINHSTLENTGFISAIIILILTPTYIWFIPPFMVLWGMAWMFDNKTKLFEFTIEDKKIKYLFLLFMVFYFWEGIGIFYSSDKAAGMNIWLSRLSLLFFPLFFLKPGKKIIENNSNLLKVFSLSTSIFIFICFIFALWRSISFSNGNLIFNPHPQKEYWMNYFFSSFFAINQHPSYLSMYVLISIFISFESYLDKSIRLIRRILWLINGIFLSTSIYFLSSRFGLLTLIILIPLYLGFNSYKNIKFIKWFGIALVLGILILVIRTNERVKINMIQISENSFVQKDGRLSIWNAALQPIRHNLFFGVGIGDVKTELMNEYRLRGDKDLIDNHYNVHNQYLEILLEGGIIGIILFLMIMLLMFYIAILKRNILYILFAIIMSVFFLFETVINRLQGVSFFSLFSFLLIYYKSPEYGPLACKKIKSADDL
jgi:O-antigen ligase